MCWKRLAPTIAHDIAGAAVEGAITSQGHTKLCQLPVQNVEVTG
jgi:hypothetical protein